MPGKEEWMGTKGWQFAPEKIYGILHQPLPFIGVAELFIITVAINLVTLAVLIFKWGL